MKLDTLNEISPETLLEKLGLFSCPVDVWEVSRQLGIEPSESLRFGASHSGEIKVDNERNIHIWINPFDHPNRQRFTLAHEIGHLINDVIPNLEQVDICDEFIDDAKTLKRDGRQHPAEFRANDFAARLLMPEDLIVSEGIKILESAQSASGSVGLPSDIFLDKMANKFKVSRQAMQIRLENLGIHQKS